MKREHVYDKSGKSSTTDVYFWLLDGSYSYFGYEMIEVMTITKSVKWDDNLRLEMGSADLLDMVLR